MSGTIKKLQFAEGTSVTQPTDLTISEVINNVAQYANDAAFEAANPGFLEGAIYYNTTLDLIRMYRGTWVTVAYETVTQTLTSKTLTAPDISAGSYVNMLAQSAIRFNDDSGDEYVALQAPTGVTTHTLNLPAAQGAASTTLTNDGSGNLSWAAAASTTLNQFNTDIGNSSNTRTAVNTSLIGEIKATAGSSTVTITIATPGVVSFTSHGLVTGDKIYLTTTGALPTGLSASTTYYVVGIDANSFSLATNLTNALAATRITTSGSQSGVHTLFYGGLVLNENVKGRYAGSTIDVGFVGQTITATSASNESSGTTAANTYYDSTNLQLTVTPGVWHIEVTTSVFSVYGGTANTNGATALAIRTGSTVVNEVLVHTWGDTAGGNARITENMSGMHLTTYVNVSSSTTYKASLRWQATSGTPSNSTVAFRGTNTTGIIRATRIA